MDIFEQYASSDEAPANDSPTSGIEKLEAALHKAKTQQNRMLSGGDDPQNPMPFWVENQERHRKQNDEIKQRSDDLRVVAEFFRSYATVSPPEHPDIIQDQPPEAKTWVSAKRAKTLFCFCCSSINRFIDNPRQYSWLEGCYTKGEKQTRNQWWIEKLYLTLRDQGCLKGNPSLESLLTQSPEQGHAPNTATEQLVQLATRRHTCK
jgi:hypothetical protein